MKQTQVTNAAAGVEDNELKTFFSRYLNRIYCAKSHMVERLSELVDQAYFKDIRQAVKDTLADVEKQITRMDEIYGLIKAEPSIINCDGIVALMEDAYNDIHNTNSVVVCDLSILFYMLNIESVEMASFRVLKMASSQLQDARITTLLTQNFNEAKADRALYLAIANKYI